MCIRDRTHVAVGFEPYDVRQADGQLFFYFFECKAAASGPFSVDSGVLLRSLLLRSDLGDFIFRQKAGISFAYGNQFLGERLIYGSAAALDVTAVSSGLSVRGSSLVEIYAEEFEGVYDYVHSPFDVTLVVGVLNAEKENSAGLVGKTFIGKGSEQVAQMDEACGAWSQSRCV